MKINSILFTILLSCISHLSHSQTGNEVMRKCREQMLTNDQSVEITMELINKRGMKRIREIIRKSKTDENENVSQIIQFLSPADIRGTGFLSIESSKREDDRWLYLPALKKTRRIPASQQSAKFMGSCFTYEDITTEKINQFDYKITGSEKIKDQNCYILEAIPNNEKTKSESGYSKRIIYLHKDNHIMIRVIYFDKKGIKIKELNNDDIRKIENTNKWRAHKMEMEEIKSGNKTILLYKDFKINSGINNTLFTKENLERDIK